MKRRAISSFCRKPLFTIARKIWNIFSFLDIFIEDIKERKTVGRNMLEYLPESNESIAILSTDDMYTSFWNIETFEKVANIRCVRWPRKVLQSNNDIHFESERRFLCFFKVLLRTQFKDIFNNFIAKILNRRLFEFVCKLKLKMIYLVLKVYK